MAEAVPNEEKDDDESPIEIKRNKDDNLECAVCLQTCIHPAQLPCGHIFCFLCVKGIANQSKKCAMCRTEIPSNFLEQPNLLQKPSVADTTDGFDGGYQWFYEGRNGWWQYDERTSRELEACYKNGERSCELLIAGFLYVADLEAMLQLRRNDPSRRRRIKRDLANIPKKGIAGLRTDGATQQTHTDVGDDYLEARRSSSPTIDRNIESLTPTTPSNTPQSPTSGRESPQRDDDLQATMERISSLQLDSNTRSGIMRGVNITESNSNNEENRTNDTDNNRTRNRNRFLYRHRNVD